MPPGSRCRLLRPTEVVTLKGTEERKYATAEPCAGEPPLRHLPLQRWQKKTQRRPSRAQMSSELFSLSPALRVEHAEDPRLHAHPAVKVRRARQAPATRSHRTKTQRITVNTRHSAPTDTEYPMTAQHGRRTPPPLFNMHCNEASTWKHEEQLHHQPTAVRHAVPSAA